MKNLIIKSLILLSFVFTNCKHSTSIDENPDWIKSLITKYQNEHVGNPPQSIWRYDYKGQIVYFVPQQCCDQPSILYDANGNVICAPDGGFSGQGDGRCTDFFQLRKNEKLIWQDSRTR
jgi:hypothetical protein